MDRSEARRGVEEDGEINIFHECDLSLRIPYVCFDHGIEVSVYFIQRGRLTRATILSWKFILTLACEYEANEYGFTGKYVYDRS